MKCKQGSAQKTRTGWFNGSESCECCHPEPLLYCHRLQVQSLYLSSDVTGYKFNHCVGSVIVTKATQLCVSACRPNRPSDLVSELGPPPNAGVRGGQGAPLPLTTATTDEHRQAASSSREAKGGPTFKLVLACGPTEKICGAELVARTLRSTARGSNLNGSAEPAAGSSSDTEVAAEQAGEEADKEGDDIMCEASVEGICADLSKDVSQDGGPRSFQRHAGIAAQHGSSAGLVMDGSGSDDEVEPGLAEEAVVTRRDILLRAVKQRKRNIADNSVTINSLFNSRKVSAATQLPMLAFLASKGVSACAKKVLQ